MSKHIQTGQQHGGSPIVFKSGDPVSIVCVAATFTDVSYANNGGMVQLSSSGVHRLTTSPAVGANVYVSWSGGAGVNGLYKVLSVDSTTSFTIDLAYTAGLGTPVVAVVNTELIFKKINLPALSLNANLVLYNEWSFTASTNNKTMILRLNASAVQYQAFGSNYTQARFISRLANKNSLTSQSAIEMPYFPSAVGTTKQLTQDTSVSLPLTISGRIVAANEVLTLEMFLFEVFL